MRRPQPQTATKYVMVHIPATGLVIGPVTLYTDGTVVVAEAASPVPVIASGGVRGIEDVRAAVEADLIHGIIIGRAIYEGRIDLAAAIDAYDDGGTE